MYQTLLCRHFELLVNNHSLANAFTMMENILKVLKYQIDQATDNAGTTVSVEKYMQECDFDVSRYYNSIARDLACFCTISTFECGSYAIRLQETCHLSFSRFLSCSLAVQCSPGFTQSFVK